MANELEVSTSSLPQCVRTKGEAYPYSALWERKREWLPWKSNDQERGLKAHRVTPGGYLEEAGDRQQPRKKIKAISSRQWER